MGPSPSPVQGEPGKSHTRVTHVRWVVLGLIFLLSTITYLDRVNISIAARYITSEYGLTDVQMGKVFSAFILAYGLFQVPGGWLGDRFGPRVVLTCAVLWWSGFTAFTACPNRVPLPVVGSLVLIRFCLGMGEAAAWPNFNRTIATWIPARERALATSVPLTGGSFGAALTPPLIAWAMLTFGWKEAFYISAFIGIVAAVLWFVYVRNTPAQHSAVSRTELRLIQGDAIDEGQAIESRAAAETSATSPSTPWRAIFTEANVWLLFASAMSCGYLVYIYMSWFYVYLTEGRGLSVIQGSLYTAGPFIAMSLMTPVGGLLCDKVARRFGRTLGRRLVSILGMSLSGAALFLGVHASNINVAIVGLSVGAGAIYFALSAHWATTIDISRVHAGTVSGVMNWGGNMGGMVSPILTPVLVKMWGWQPALDLAGGIILVGALTWFFIRPERPLRTSPGDRLLNS